MTYSRKCIVTSDTSTLHQGTRYYGAPIRSPNYKKRRPVHWKLQVTGVVTSQQLSPVWVTMKLGNMQHGWVLTQTHKTMRGLGFQWQWPLKIIYSVMWRLTVWQILTDVLENTTAPTCGVIKIPRKDTGTWWKNTGMRIFGSLVSSSHPNPPVLSQSYVPTPNRYYTLRHQAGRQRMQLNGSIPAIEPFNFNWPNGRTTYG